MIDNHYLTTHIIKNVSLLIFIVTQIIFLTKKLLLCPFECYNNITIIIARWY